MTEILNFSADTLEKPIKIKEYFTKELGFSTSLLTKVKTSGVFINGIPVHMRATLNPRDKITVYLPKEKSEGITPIDIPISVIYEDEHILAVNKPIGMPTHPSRGNSLPTLAEAVMNYYGSDFVFRAVSRLDKDTSGIVLIAKNAYASALLGRAMKNGEIEKEYIAVIKGVPKEPHGIIEAPIERLCEGNVKRGVIQDGKYAKTEYEVLSITEDENSVIRVKLHTGRTHQIRVHMSYIGHPLLGDSLYGDFPKTDTYKLHCHRISFNFLSRSVSLSCIPDFYAP